VRGQARHAADASAVAAVRGPRDGEHLVVVGPPCCDAEELRGADVAQGFKGPCEEARVGEDEGRGPRKVCEAELDLEFAEAVGFGEDAGDDDGDVVCYVVSRFSFLSFFLSLFLWRDN
jgi:hypothetical protein